MIYMGMIILPEISLSWSKKKTYRGTFASSVMSTDRFELLLRFLFLNDNTHEHTSTDKLYKKDLSLMPLQTDFKPYTYQGQNL